jgi:hypothetical protein
VRDAFENLVIHNLAQRLLDRWINRSNPMAKRRLVNCKGEEKAMRRILLLSAALTLSGCGEEAANEGYGSATVAALTTDEVERIRVAVSAANVFQDVVAELSHDPATGTWSGTIADIPSGPERTFHAEAFDAAGGLLYSGTEPGVTIVDGQQLALTIVLQETTLPDRVSNTAPAFTSLLVSPGEVEPDGVTNLTVTAADPGSVDAVSYYWTADGGSFDAIDQASVQWAAPSTEGIYRLKVFVTGPAGATVEVSFFVSVATLGDGAAVAVDLNTWPEVQELAYLNFGLNTALDLTTMDPDGDPLTFSWVSDCAGTFSDASAEDPTFTVDVSNAGVLCSITVTVDDGRGGRTTEAITIGITPTLTEEDLACIGYRLRNLLVWPLDDPELPCDD